MGIRNTVVRTLAATGLIASSVLISQAGPAQAASAGTGDKGGGTTCSVIDFDKAAVLGATTNAVRHELVVTGTTATAGVKVTLVPLTYIRQPEFWGIEVTGCTSQVGLQVVTPFTARLNIDGTIGTIGVEVIGATRSQLIPLILTSGPKAF
jgi:hypothetical protein